MDNSEFKLKIIRSLKKQYITIGKQSGFNLPHITGDKISIANTVEALLILEIHYPNFKNKNYDELQFINFDYIYNNIYVSLNNILKYSNEEQRVLDIAYCGIGLLMFGSDEVIDNLAEYLKKNQCDLGGWGHYIKNSPPDLLETYLVSKFLYRYDNNFRLNIPKWMYELPKNADGTCFSPKSENNTNNRISIEALTLFSYTFEKYYKQTVDTEYKYSINKYFKENIKHIINAEENFFIKHPISDYSVFSFGLAAYLVKDINEPFFNDLDICARMTEDFMNIIKNIPYALELSRLVFIIKDYYDPFKQKSIVSNHLSLSNKKIEQLELSINEQLKNTNSLIEKMSFEITVYILLILLIIALSYFFINTAIVNLLPELKYKNLVINIGATIVPLIMGICDILSKIVKLIFRVYSKISLKTPYIQQKKEKKINE